MYKSNRLFDEFIDIERDNTSGKIDHTTNFHKDALDAVCGATFNASKFAEEFAYDYGESLEDTITFNKESSATSAEQLALDFEAEMQRLLDPLKEKREEHSIKVQPLTQQPNAYVFDNMIIW